MTIREYIWKQKLKITKFLRYAWIGICAALLTLLIGWNAQPSIARNADTNSLRLATDATPSVPSSDRPSDLILQGKQQYQAGQYVKALATWQQAHEIYVKQSDLLNQSIALQNLALANRQLGRWQEADLAIGSSLEILQADPQPKFLVQALNIQADIQLAQGKAKEALTTWQKVTETFEQLGDRDSAIRSKISQSQAMRALGLYPKAKDTLKQVQLDIQDRPDSLLKAATLLNLGDTLRLNGDLKEAETTLIESQRIALKLNDANTITNALLSLGNTANSQKQTENAIAFYRQANTTATSPTVKVQAMLNQMRIQIELKNLKETRKLLPDITAELQKIPPSRSAIYARVNLGQRLMEINPTPSDRADAAQLLATAAQQAKDMGDPRAESYAKGYLGELYEKNQQPLEAQALTEQALILAQTNYAPDIAYLWQWQLGRLLKSRGENKSAIAAYSEAVSTLASIRGDLVSSSSDVQFSFRDRVEPVYRQLVELLLTPENNKPVSNKNLEDARAVIESLQLAELDNFFKEACLSGKPQEIDTVDRQAAVVYPIILPNSLEVIVSLPDRTLLHHSNKIPQSKLENLFKDLTNKLSPTAWKSETQDRSKKIYDLLLNKDIEAALKANKIKTLAFVLDGSLRNLPMAVLYDGNKYLIEKYNIALTPGLQLLDPRPLKRQKLEVFLGGVSKANQGYIALPYVDEELKQIANVLPSQEKALLNETFVNASIQEQISKIPFRVVHLATHGEFSSDVDKTFILTWNARLGVREIGELLKTREQESRTPIELLVLSACKTAQGDKRAALGLAGLALRSGARSTIATLWSVNDRAAEKFMGNFYRELAKPDTTKADALRIAQLSLINDPSFAHPRYWAPFVLVGNWL